MFVGRAFWLMRIYAILIFPTYRHVFETTEKMCGPISSVKSVQGCVSKFYVKNIYYNVEILINI